MTHLALARAYLEKCELRLLALRLFMEHEGWSDVVREAQELVELAIKGILRAIGADPPKLYEVSGSLHAHHERLPGIDLERLAEASIFLRKHRELAFYGAEDLIPTLAYTEAEARKAQEYAEFSCECLRKVLATISPGG